MEGGEQNMTEEKTQQTENNDALLSPIVITNIYKAGSSAYTNLLWNLHKKVIETD